MDLIVIDQLTFKVVSPVMNLTLSMSQIVD